LLEKIIELLIALTVATGAQGLGTAAGHADPAGNQSALDAIAAAIQRATDRIATATTPVAADVDLPDPAADRASEALADAAAAKAAGQAKADAAQANAGKPDGAGKPADTPDAPVSAPRVDPPAAAPFDPPGPPDPHPSGPPIDPPGKP
jgi:hypothetical protein